MLPLCDVILGQKCSVRENADLFLLLYFRFVTFFLFSSSTDVSVSVASNPVEYFSRDLIFTVVYIIGFS